MKRLMIAGLAGAAALMAATAANALTFAYSGHIDSYTVATSGWYEIDAWGAQGGSYYTPYAEGGLGAMVGGRIYLDAGQVLDIVVGGEGRSTIEADTGSGGGGGSFVFTASDLDLLLAAGGGGGSRWSAGSGGPGLAGRNGGGVGGGVDGMGGAAAGDRYGFAGGGAGWLSSGESGTTGVHGAGGSNGPSFAGGETHGCVNTIECMDGWSGGFGGGGGAAYNDGGGGGGYSGGAAGAGGGGGGSYIADSFYDFVGQSGVRAGNGLVTIDLLPVPEPAAWAVMLLGFFSLGGSLRRRRGLP